jgi:hypothetical protein
MDNELIAALKKAMGYMDTARSCEGCFHFVLREVEAADTAKPEPWWGTQAPHPTTEQLNAHYPGAKTGDSFSLYDNRDWTTMATKPESGEWHIWQTPEKEKVGPCSHCTFNGAVDMPVRRGGHCRYHVPLDVVVAEDPVLRVRARSIP